MPAREVLKYREIGSRALGAHLSIQAEIRGDTRNREQRRLKLLSLGRGISQFYRSLGDIRNPESSDDFLERTGKTSALYYLGVLEILRGYDMLGEVAIGQFSDITQSNNPDDNIRFVGKVLRSLRRDPDEFKRYAQRLSAMFKDMYDLADENAFFSESSFLPYRNLGFAAA